MTTTAIPAMETIGPTGKIRASPYNNNFTAIHDTVNTYVPFLGAANTFSAANAFAAITATTGAFSGALTGTTGAFTGAVTVAGLGITTASGAAVGYINKDATYGTIITSNAGATDDFQVRDHIGVVRLRITTAGVLTAETGLTVTTGGLTVTAGTTALAALTCTTFAPSGTSTLQAATCTTLTVSSTLTLSASSSKIVPGATSLLLRNNADSATNLTIADGGDITTRSAGTFTSAGPAVFSGAVSFANMPFCTVLPTTSQAVTTGNPVLCSTEEIDASAMHDTGSNTGRITIPTGMGGTYVFIARIMATGGPSAFQWKLNNTTTFGTWVNLTNGDWHVTGIRTLVAGDYVELRNVGSNTLTLTGNASESVLHAYRVS